MYLEWLIHNLTTIGSNIALVLLFTTSKSYNCIFGGNVSTHLEILKTVVVIRLWYPFHQ